MCDRVIEVKLCLIIILSEVKSMYLLSLLVDFIRVVIFLAYKVYLIAAVVILAVIAFY